MSDVELDINYTGYIRNPEELIPLQFDVLNPNMALEFNSLALVVMIHEVWLNA
jgi:hypothetical protein